MHSDVIKLKGEEDKETYNRKERVGDEQKATRGHDSLQEGSEHDLEMIETRET